MNSEYSHEVEKLSSDFSLAVSSSGAFTREEISALNNSISNRVLPLLNVSKPKILVYGIYNAGKSTLVNAIMKHEVAEVGNRPTTHKTTEYDAGRYILVDSPGIDTPSEEDEQIADNYIKSCHVILFVVSSKLFESIENYEKMWSIIQMNIPFIIVINDIGVMTSEYERHLADINRSKRKLIENLIKVSGQNDIESRYDVIVLNALRAWNGIINNQPRLIEGSNLSDLTNRIEQLLEGSEAMKLFMAPLSALERNIGEAEKILMSKIAGNDYAVKRAVLQNKFSQFTESFNENLRFSAERYFDVIYQGYLGRSSVDMQRIYNDICRDSEDTYKRSSAPLITYIRDNFSELHISVDEAGHVTLNAPSENMNQYHRDTDNYRHEESYIDTSSSSSSYSAAMTAAGTALGSIIGTFVPAIGTVAGGIIGGALGKFADSIMGNSRHEREDYDRRLREIEAYNERQERRAEEENRRRQDARIAATNQINSIVRNLRASYAEIIEHNLNGVMNLIDEAISRIAKTNKAITDTLGKLKNIRNKIHELRRQILC